MPFVLVAVAIPAYDWTKFESRLQSIKEEFEVGHEEIHASVLGGDYPEQSHIDGFEQLDHSQRKEESLRIQACFRKSSTNGNRLEKSHKKREPFLHLTAKERQNLLVAIAAEFASWPKVFFTVCAIDASASPKSNRHSCCYFNLLQSIDVTASKTMRIGSPSALGTDGEMHPTLCVLVHDTLGDSKDAVMAAMLNKALQDPRCTTFGPTPLFVDSRNTNLLQLADVCAHAVRAYLDKGESSLLKLLLPKLHLPSHITNGHSCNCLLCTLYSD